MEALLGNLLSSRVRREVRNGREYLVAPMTLIVPGVLNGSKGALYYPPEEVAKDPTVWNGMPIVVYHPLAKDGSPLSARDPAVLDRAQVGEVFNARVSKNGRLIADGWFSVKDTERVDNRVLQALKAGKKIELSTGLFTDNEAAPQNAAFNNRAYSYIARNYRPDHLAILPDQTGACSVSDGCGVNVNKRNGAPRRKTLNAKGDNTMAKKLSDKQREAIVNGLIANECCWEEEDREMLQGLSDNRLLQFRQQAEEDKERTATVNALRKRFKVKDSVTVNAEFVEKLPEATTNEPPVPPKPPAKPGEPCEPGTQNCGPDGKGKEPAQNKKLTDAEWLDQAPQSIREAVQFATNAKQKEKDAIVAKLTANVAKEKKEAVVNRLQKMDLDALQDLLALEPPKPAANGDGNDRSPLFFGASAPANNAADDDDEDDYLPIPTINWAEEAAARKAK